MKEGIAVVCEVCRRSKKPYGRSAPMEMAASLCAEDCPGYFEKPLPGDLWPGETEEEFGFPVSEHAVREAERA